MNVLVTGARGFIGRNLIAQLRTDSRNEVAAIDVENSKADLEAALKSADIVYHLAGVNRPQSVEEFEAGNAELTREICGILRELGRKPAVVMSSSVQAALDNPYGASKRRAEEALREFAAGSGARVSIYRLKNVFGKWCRPNYNSVVATFCHNVVNNLPLEVSDPAREIELIYVGDVVKAFIGEMEGRGTRDIPSVKLTLGELADRIRTFREMRTNLLTPDFGVRFNQQLYATYLSHVPEEAHRQQLEIRWDQRGGLAEFIKSANFGQVFISRTKPGVTRGNHYHQTKTEKFLVVEGTGVVRMRHIETGEVVEYRVEGEAFQVIDIPPGHTHSIENIGPGDMVTLFWASEIFDPQNADTYYLPVLTAASQTAGVTA